MNKKGLSLLGLLITVLIIAVLLSIMLPKYQKTVTTQHSQQKQAVEQARQTVRQLEKVSAQRAQGLPDNL